ncbi:MAG: hypothetical protein AB7P76_10240 [Candidatus Melainabacteria bacterium]
MPYNVQNDGIQPSALPGAKNAKGAPPADADKPAVSKGNTVFQPEPDVAVTDELKVSPNLFDSEEQAKTAEGFWQASDDHSETLQGADAAVSEAQKRTLKTSESGSPFSKRPGVVDAFMKARVDAGTHELSEEELDDILGGLNQDHSLFGIASKPQTED